MEGWHFFLLAALIILNVRSETSSRPESSFRVLPLCDTSILVTWKPSTNESHESHERITYSFFYQEISGTKLGPKIRAWRTADAKGGQIKLNEFKENTRYRILVYEDRPNQESREINFVESGTRKIDFTEPPKPDFTYEIVKEKFLDSNVKIRWLPCGRQQDCRDETPGCNFFVKYRIKGAEEFKKVSEYYEDYAHVTDCLPGYVYEFFVVSSNLPSETESEIREIIIPPEAGPVENLSALPLNSFSVLLTWDPPRQTKGNLTGYKIFYEVKEMPFEFVIREQFNRVAPNRTRIIISHLLPKTDYKISVVARTDAGLGTTNSVTARTLENDVTMSAPFKPQAHFEVIDAKFELPKVKIVWLPCGVEKNCNGQKAGSYFKTKYRLENETKFCQFSEYDQDSIVIENLLPGVTYEFVVVSVDGIHETESDTRKIAISDSGQHVVETVQGHNVSIPCNLSADAKLPLKWLKNDREIFPDQFIELKDSNLQIRNVSIKHSGKYDCTIPSSSDTSHNIVFLLVKKQTKVYLDSTSPKHRVLHVGEKHTRLQCRVSTDPSLIVTLHEWLKNGTIIHSGPTSSSTISIDGDTLTLSNVKVEDTANYTCVASTRLDKASDSAEIIVTDA